MNSFEMKENKKLTEVIQNDLNKNPFLKNIEDESLDAVLCTVSIDYLIQVRGFFVTIHREDQL